MTDATTLTLVLSGAKASTIESTADVGPQGGLDTLDVTAGFSKDVFGNAATTDAASDAALTIDNNVFTVTKTADTNDGSCTLSDCSIREAIVASNATTNTTETIIIPAGTYAITIAGSVNDQNPAIGDFNITDDVIIDGAGLACTTINGLANNWWNKRNYSRFDHG